MIYIGIILTILTLGVIAVAFFLFAIWRAIIGKSSVDLKLATSVDIQTKRIEALNKSMNGYDTTNQNLMNEAREIKRHLKDIISSNEAKSGGNTD